ncbi:MAG TPA: hypothetical protein VHD83_05455 [Puia sp.]|nr:hypothetical protein [Puia sp.]
MKVRSYLPIALTLLFAACSKSISHQVHGTGAAGSWLLVNKQQVIGAGSHDTQPTRFTSVRLTLNDDSTYTSRLNDQIVSQGAYSIIRDTSGDYVGTLELKDFKTTGIFSLFYLYEMGANGQPSFVYSGMSMNISNDTMTLSSLITPGGWIIYQFKRG